jgi:hypothetical protein
MKGTNMSEANQTTMAWAPSKLENGIQPVHAFDAEYKTLGVNDYGIETLAKCSVRVLRRKLMECPTTAKERDAWLQENRLWLLGLFQAQGCNGSAVRQRHERKPGSKAAAIANDF